MPFLLSPFVRAEVAHKLQLQVLQELQKRLKRRQSWQLSLPSVDETMRVAIVFAWGFQERCVDPFVSPGLFAFVFVFVGMFIIIISTKLNSSKKCCFFTGESEGHSTT